VLLTITTTTSPATDLGYLLFKHPDKVQRFDQAFGTSHVFYPEASQQRCTAALLLEVDPVRLVRTKGGNSPDFTLGQYVNDRPYAASSLLSAAMANVFRTAMRGRCDARQDLADGPIPLEINLPALPCKGGPDLAGRLFAPLGWQVAAEPVPLDGEFPQWGDSRYVTLTLTGTIRLADALNQLYVLLPVLDDSKHYWVAPDEVDKLIRAGEGWLATHPERARITRRYLSNKRSLIRTALHRLAEADDGVEDAFDRDPIDEEPAPTEETAPRTPLNEMRIQAVLDVLHEEQAASVIDLGCGSGKLLTRLLQDSYFRRITGTDVSYRAVALAGRRLRLDRMPQAQLERITLFTGALTYTDERFHGYDAGVLMEVIEHVDEPRLPALERVVFGDARPRVVVVTTPNAEYNVRYEGLTGMRHNDHRFEWTREQFQAWAAKAADRYGYRVRYVPVGEEDPETGSPTQMGVFTR
jgi:3' terminal RNA ribose 2'-O-methyltransferase Hen1